MAELTTLARPYAVAAYRRAKETGTSENWAGALDFIASLMDSPEIARAAANPKADRTNFEYWFIDLCQGGYLDVDAQNFARLLVRNRRLNLAKHIASLFSLFKAEDEGYVDVKVRSAFPVENSDEAALADVLERALGKRPKISVVVDPSLIGGLFISAGDRVIDASIRGQVERLAKRLCN